MGVGSFAPRIPSPSPAEDHLKKYIVFPGIVWSKNDSDRHYIGYARLCRLYGISPEETVDGSRHFRVADVMDLIVLSPCFEGDYVIDPAMTYAKYAGL